MPLVDMFAYLFAIHVISKSKRRIRTFLLIIGQTVGLILAIDIAMVIYGTLTQTAWVAGLFSELVLPIAIFGSSSVQLRAIRRAGKLSPEDVWLV